MNEFQLDMYQVAGVAAVMFWIGSWIVKKSAFLSKYCIGWRPDIRIGKHRARC